MDRPSLLLLPPPLPRQSLCGQLATDERIGMHTFVSSREDMSDRYMKVAPSLLRWTGRVYETFPGGEKTFLPDSVCAGLHGLLGPVRFHPVTSALHKLHCTHTYVLAGAHYQYASEPVSG